MKGFDKSAASMEIMEAILDLTDEFSEKPEYIGYDEDILELGILDSPSILELIAWIEKTFSVDIADNEITIDNFGTINAIVIFISKRRGSGIEQH